MPTPLVEIKQGAGAYQPQAGGFNATPGSVVTYHLIDSSADAWATACVTTDDLGDAAAVNAGLTIDPNAKTATFTVPNFTGRAYRLYSQVNGGVDLNGVRRPSYTTTFTIYTLTAENRRVIAADEQTEGNSVFGYIASLNDVIRNPASGGGSAGPAGALELSAGGGAFASLVGTNTGDVATWNGSAWVSSPVTTTVPSVVVNVLDYYVGGDGTPTINGHTTRNIALAFGRAYAAKVGTTKHLTLWIPPCDTYGVAAWSWDTTVAIDAVADKQWTLEIRGSGAASKIIPARTSGITTKLQFNAGGPATQSLRLWYHDMFWVGDSATTTDCVTLLATQADMSVLVEDCTFYGLRASGAGLLQLDSDNLIARRLHLHGCGNDTPSNARISVVSGFWGTIFQQCQFVPAEHATDPFGDAPFDKDVSTSSPCWDTWLQGDDVSHPPLIRYDQCIFGGNANMGAVKADPDVGSLEAVRFDQCVARDGCLRLIQATHDVHRIVIDGCYVSHNDGAVTSVDLLDATCAHLVVKRSHFTHGGIRVHANTGQRAVTVEDHEGGTWDCAGAGKVSVCAASTFDGFSGTETGYHRSYKLKGASVAAASVRLKDFDGNDVTLADGKSYLIEIRFDGGRTDASGSHGSAVVCVHAHASGLTLTKDDDTALYDQLFAGWNLTVGTSGLALTVDFAGDAGTVEGYADVTVYEVGAFSSGTFDLASLSWDGLWYDFADAGGGAPTLPIVGHASAGSSATQNIVTNGADPTIGTALNSKGVLHFNGTSQMLKTVGDLAAFTTTSAWSMAIVFKPASTQTGHPTTPYSDPCLVANGDGIWGAGSTDQGGRSWKFDSAAGGTYEIDTATTSATAAAYAYLFVRYDGVKVYTKLVKSGSAGSWSAGTPAATDWGGEPTTLVNMIGSDNTGAAAFFSGDLAFVGLSKTAFSTADFDNIKTALNALFAESF